MWCHCNVVLLYVYGENMVNEKGNFGDVKDRRWNKFVTTVLSDIYTNSDKNIHWLEAVALTALMLTQSETVNITFCAQAYILCICNIQACLY